jgi:thiamine-phosphate diphosphorylase
LVREAASAGVDWVQIREPGMAAGALSTFVRAALQETAGSSCRVLVNDRVDVALTTGAAGVHLRADSMSGRRVRSIAPGGFLIGRSVHAAEEAARVDGEGACDYVIFGTVFPSKSKPAGHQVAGLTRLEDVCRSTSLPVIAVGGISVENAHEVIAAGARGVAGIDLFRSPGTLSATVAKLRRQFDS